MVGLDGASSDQVICAKGLGFSQQKFQLAGLVPPKSQTGLVVAFDQQGRTIQRCRK
jgi:hypothetical protein